MVKFARSEARSLSASGKSDRHEHRTFALTARSTHGDAVGGWLCHRSFRRWRSHSALYRFDTDVGRDDLITTACLTSRLHLVLEGPAIGNRNRRTGEIAAIARRNRHTGDVGGTV